MARIRTFIAVDPGTAIKDRLVSLQKSLAETAAEVKWVEPDNLHFTLLFLGEVDERDVTDVCKAVHEAARSEPSFSAVVAGVSCFGSPRRPRTIWVGLKQGAHEMIALHDALETPLLELGCYRRENRAFTPHLTLGRVRGERPMPQLAAALHGRQTWKAGETSVDEVLVMSSQLKPAGPVYAVLSRCKLHGQPSVSVRGPE